jgi:4-hydroxy-tetrahydrodipicolinate synthase
MVNELALPGVMAPVLTPFTSDLRCDGKRFVGFCRWLERQGMGLAVFGTNSEANSLTLEERIELLDTLIEAGVAPSSLVPGSGACAFGDSVRLSQRAARQGCAGVLMLPPFYYKGVSDEGLFAAFAEVIERVGDQRLKVLLYHIPQVSGVPITLGLIERLITRYPQTIAGLKDSSGDLNYSKAAIDRFPGFRVYAGSDALLLATLKHGGAGCISATANVNPQAIVRLRQDWRGEKAEEAQARLTQIRKTFEGYPMIAALKSAAAHYGEHPEFATVRPPLTALTEGQRNELVKKLSAHNFAMPGLEKALTSSGEGM